MNVYSLHVVSINCGKEICYKLDCFNTQEEADKAAKEYAQQWWGATGHANLMPNQEALWWVEKER